jgi:hypothetical protein
MSGDANAHARVETKNLTLHRELSASLHEIWSA